MEIISLNQLQGMLEFETWHQAGDWRVLGSNPGTSQQPLIPGCITSKIKFPRTCNLKDKKYWKGYYKNTYIQKGYRVTMRSFISDLFIHPTKNKAMYPSLFLLHRNKGFFQLLFGSFRRLLRPYLLFNEMCSIFIPLDQVD